MSATRWFCNSFLIPIVFAFVFLIQFCFSEKAPYYSFAKDAKIAPTTEKYDYIVVGGGTSGCALAATLSQGSRVLLLERGGLPYGNPTVSTIGGFAATLANTSPTSASQLFISTDGVFNHRARVLGGGSALNAGFYTRASADYVTKAGWDPRLVKQSYEWVEKKVAFEPKVMGWQSAVRNGLLEAGVSPYNGFTYDHLPGTKIGGSIFDQNGFRHTAADLLEYAIPTNITVYLHAVAHQILFKTQGVRKPTAQGIVFKDSKGSYHWAYLNEGPKNEIIVSAGALGSPQLLMLSGIGPAQQLMSLGIKVVMDQPLVGQEMSDNPMNGIVVPSPQPVEISLIQAVGITRLGTYIEAASGSAGFNWVQSVQAQIQSDPNQTWGPFFDFFNKTIPGEIMSELATIATASIQSGFILEKVIGPLSTGYLELMSRDPNENPKVTFNYFQDPTDLQRCVDGIEIIKKVIDSKSFAPFRYPFATGQALQDAMVTLPVNLRPKHLITSAISTEQFCKDTVMTIWHYHGGCRVGSVVDKNYRVMGVDALRVVDGSTFIDSPGTNPQATVMMLGRYMGQRILGERFSS